MILLFQYNCLSVSLELEINIIIELLKGTFSVILLVCCLI